MSTDPIKRLRKVGERRAALDDERRQITAELTAAANEAREQGHSMREIAEAAGVSSQAVYDLIKGKYGLGVRRGRPKS